MSQGRGYHDPYGDGPPPYQNQQNGPRLMSVPPVPSGHPGNYGAQNGQGVHLRYSMPPEPQRHTYTSLAIVLSNNVATGEQVIPVFHLKIPDCNLRKMILITFNLEYEICSRQTTPQLNRKLIPPPYVIVLEEDCIAPRYVGDNLRNTLEIEMEDHIHEMGRYWISATISLFML